MTEKIENEPVPETFLRVLGRPYLRATALRCIANIFRKFFIQQSMAAFLPGRIPVSIADHPLDKKIPFLPGKINIYIDFVAFWVRTLGFLLRNYGRKVFEPVRYFMETMGGLYSFAAEVYSKNLSTTDRPFYIGRPRFLLIHAADPHLMCIPSLHVMVVIRTHTFFRDFFKTLEADERLAPQAEELRRGALAITEAVLYVKQHSVNCIPAAMYAMTCFDPKLFPPDEAERFAKDIFRNVKVPAEKDGEEIRSHIISLYNRFCAERAASLEQTGTAEKIDKASWKEPLLNFLGTMPRQ